MRAAIGLYAPRARPRKPPHDEGALRHHQRSASRVARVKFFLLAGEQSGDELGGKLMDALRRSLGDAAAFAGVGGPSMEARGLRSLFPISEIAVMGFVPVVRRLPLILRRIQDAATAVVEWRPDALVLIDSPDFTHRVARRARRALPSLPVVDYVSPSVWAWRSGRARAMRAYVDRVLALLPFEPEAHRRLGGPPCSYVGHPLVERLDDLRPNALERERRQSRPPVGLILPGSRRFEIEQLLDDFGAAAAGASEKFGQIDWVLPAVDHLEALIRSTIAKWPWRPRLALGERAKHEAFRSARVALAASGTVTLELALSQVPMVVAYKVSRAEELLKFLVTAPSIVLPNLILGFNAIPELLQRACAPSALADHVVALLADSPQRAAQLEAFETIDGFMRLPDGLAPSDVAARLCIEAAARPR